MKTKIKVYNKFLRDWQPIEKVCSPDKIHWIEAKLKHEGEYETEFYIFTYNTQGGANENKNKYKRI